jgi:hypothetical protein
MLEGVKPRHGLEDKPTLRQHLHKAGFINIVSANKKDKWIGISDNIKTAKNEQM